MKFIGCILKRLRYSLNLKIVMQQVFTYAPCSSVPTVSLYALLKSELHFLNYSNGARHGRAAQPLIKRIRICLFIYLLI